MANIEEVKNKKIKTKELIEKALKENPDVGPHEFVGSFLRLRGYNVDSNDPEKIKETVKGLKMSEKHKVVTALSSYKKQYDEAIADLSKKDYAKLMKIPGNAIGTLTKGAAYGIGVAGTINTIAPGLYSTALGYLAGSGIVSQNTLVNLGLVSAGIFSQPVVSAGAIVAVGAAVGAVTYGTGKLVLSGIKGIAKGIKNNHKNNEQENEK